MNNQTVVKDIQKELGRLPFEQQRQVLEFIKILTGIKIQGVKGKELLRFAGCIEHEELMNIDQAIKDGCEKADINKW